MLAIIGANPVWWAAFGLFVLFMLALDLGVFHRKAHEVSVKEALIWVMVWLTLALLFNAGIYLGWIGDYAAGPVRHQAALEFLTGYLIEISLSIDNVFVFALLFNYFSVDPRYRHRVLYWGILGALVMRALMIFLGVALLQRFHFLIYPLAGVLIFAGFKMWRSNGPEVDPQNNGVLKLVRRLFTVAEGEHCEKFFVRINGALAVTPLFVVLVLVEWTDLIFAVDSIPAVLAVTSDAFIVFTSNVMAILGLRSLYFALAGMMERFHALHYGLAAILVFVGVKMLVAGFFKIPIGIALGVVALILIVSVVVSLMTPPPPKTEK